MARKPEDKTVRIAKSLAARATLNAASIGWSFNQFCENAVQTMCDMIDDPKKRVVPDAVLQIAAVRGPREVLAFGRSETTSKVAEDPPALKKKA